MNTEEDEPLIDLRGRVMFNCAICGGPMTRRDFFDAELRLPEYGETAQDYADAELIDRFEHARCGTTRGVRAG